MKLSTFADMLFIDSFEEQLGIIKDMNFEYIDLRSKLDGDTVDTIALDKARLLKTKMDEMGIKAGVIVSRVINPISFIGPHSYNKYDDEHHAKTLRIFDRLCDVADVFEAKYIRVTPLYRSNDYHLLSDKGREDQISHSIDVLGKFAVHPQARGKIGILENEPPSIGNKAEELGQIARGINHPNLRVNWDIVNDWRAGVYPSLEQYSHVKGLLGGAHLKGAYKWFGTESSGNPNGVFRCMTIPDQDDFDHAPLLKSITEHDPEAMMTIDTHFHDMGSDDHEVGATEVMRRSKVFFESLLQG